MRSIVVSLPSGAGVVCTEHGLVVTDDVGVGGGVGLRDDDRFHPGAASVDADHCVVGGRLPPGAVSAEVVDDRGTRVSAVVADGVFAAMLEQPHEGRDPIVCCRDAAGRFVRRPWAADYPSVRVTDTDEPCPACGATDWDEYTPFEEWRGGSGSKVDGTHVANPIVSCRICGHEEPEPGFMTMRSESTESEDEATREARIARFQAEFRKRQWHSHAEVLRMLEFPIYVADGWPAQITGHGSQDGQTTQITIYHHDSEGVEPWAGARPRLKVTTKRVPYRLEPLEEARRELQNWISNDSTGSRWPDASRAAITLWQRARERERHATVLDAVRSEHAIEVNGAPTTALMLTPPGSRWTAAVSLGDLIIVIAARELEPTDLRLRTVSDPPAELLGPEPAG
jgi:hypothetical protein